MDGARLGRLREAQGRTLDLDRRWTMVLANRAGHHTLDLGWLMVLALRHGWASSGGISHGPTLVDRNRGVVALLIKPADVDGLDGSER